MAILNPPEVSAVGFSLSCEINQKRNLVMQSHVAADASQEEMFKLVSKLCGVADTLDTRYRLIDIKLILQKAKEELPVHEKKLREFEDRTVREYNRSGRKSDFEWKGQAQTNRDNLLTTIAACRMNIDRFEKAIAEAETELEAMNGSSSTTDRFPRAANS
jgi:hypothetical protein